MFNITKFAIENTRITLTIFGLIMVMGVMAFFNLPQAEDPGFTVRKARITTLFPGASPDRIENLVTDKLEKALLEMPEVEFITSESRTGISSIIVKIQDRYKDIQPIWDTLRRKVDRTAPQLPHGVKGPFVNDEFGDVFGTLITITGDGFSYRELKEVADEIRDKLLFLGEVAKVDFYGQQEERIFIEYNDSKLADMGASAVKMQEFLESRNIVTPGGAVQTDTERIFLEPSGNFESLEDLSNTVVSIPGQKQVFYLKDLATVTRGYIDPPRSLMHCSGKPCIGLAISLREGGNITKLGEEVSEFLDQVEDTYPLGVHFDRVAFQPDEVKRRVDTFVTNLFQSVSIVILIMLFSLGFRSGFVVGGLIPMAILMSLVVMSIFGIGIDQISVAALIIALGMLVDCAIVMCESIMTEIANGKEPKEAAIGSANELRASLLTSSLTTSAAFLPIFLAKSIAGEYTANLFTVVTIALLSSWILSLTMIPLLCVHFLKNTKKSTPKEAPYYQLYRKFLLASLKKPFKPMACFAGLFVLAILSFHFVPKAFFPQSERTTFTAKIDLPVGTKIERTHEVVAELETFLMGHEGIKNWAAFIGGLTPRYILNYNPDRLSPEQAFLLINITDVGEIPKHMKAIEHFVHSHFPEALISMKPTEYGPPVTAPIAFRISGPDQEQNFKHVNALKDHLATVDGIKNIRDDWGENTKKIVALVNQPRALRAGITNRDVAISLQTALSGFDSTQYREHDDVIPVTIRTIASDREDLNNLDSLNVYSQTADVSVPLKQVADLKLLWQPNTIRRRNRMQTVTVQTDLDYGYNPQKVSNLVETWVKAQSKMWPKGYYYEVGGEKERSENSSRSIKEQIPIAALIIILLLVVQFNSFRLSAIIFLTIPMGIIGVAAGLILTGSSMGFMTFLGVVSLSGIVINDAIVLLERIQTERDLGFSHPEAILEASMRRLRPIVLTTLTTVGGMLPLWLGGGVLFKPMAIAIIFGLIFATFLTLVFVPVLYSLLFRVSFSQSSSD